MNISEKIKYLRKKNKITQEQLAKIIGVERSSVGKYETGTTPSVSILSLLADYFGVTVDYFLDREVSADILGTTVEYLRDETDDPQKPGTRQPTKDDIKFAIFDGDKDITDEQYEEVKKFAQYVRERDKK